MIHDLSTQGGRNEYAESTQEKQRRSMNHKRIKALQIHYGIYDMQLQINSGLVWHMEGSAGRAASELLSRGACMLPLARHNDFYGNRIPSRKDIKQGTKGSYRNTQDFWIDVANGDIEFEDNFDEE